MADLETLAARLGDALLARGLTLVTAESCTGGWVGEAITAIAGSSAWFDRGYITYSNRAKHEELGVGDDTLLRFGAVSEETVRAMVAGALARSGADLALAVSGVAGPSGGTPEKPVGTVCFAWGEKDSVARSETRHLAGDRRAVREQSVAIALQGVLDLLVF